MIKYLDLFEKDMKKHNADYFVEQIQLYKNMYTHYKNTSCPSPIYTGILSDTSPNDWRRTGLPNF